MDNTMVYRRKALRVLANQWTGEEAELYHLAAWVLENHGTARIAYAEGVTKLIVSVPGFKDAEVAKDDYVFRDADGKFYVKDKAFFEKFYERTDIHE